MRSLTRVWGRRCRAACQVLSQPRRASPGRGGTAGAPAGWKRPRIPGVPFGTTRVSARHPHRTWRHHSPVFLALPLLSLENICVLGLESEFKTTYTSVRDPADTRARALTARHAIRFPSPPSRGGALERQTQSSVLKPPEERGRPLWRRAGRGPPGPPREKGRSRPLLVRTPGHRGPGGSLPFRADLARKRVRPPGWRHRRSHPEECGERGPGPQPVPPGRVPGSHTHRPLCCLPRCLLLPDLLLQNLVIHVTLLGGLK